MLHFFKKVKKNTWRSHYFTPVYLVHDNDVMMWSTVPEIWSVRDWHLYKVIFGLSPPSPLPPTHLKTAAIKILKKWKVFLKISSFYTCALKFKIMWCTVLEIRSETDMILFILGHFLPFNPTNNPQNQNFEKNEKKRQEILTFYKFLP